MNTKEKNFKEKLTYGNLVFTLLCVISCLSPLVILIGAILLLCGLLPLSLNPNMISTPLPPNVVNSLVAGWWFMMVGMVLSISTREALKHEQEV